MRYKNLIQSLKILLIFVATCATTFHTVTYLKYNKDYVIDTYLSVAVNILEKDNP